MKQSEMLLLGGAALATYFLFFKKAATPAAATDLGGTSSGAGASNPYVPLWMQQEAAGTAYQELLSKIFGAGVSAAYAAQQTAAKLPVVGEAASSALGGTVDLARYASSLQILKATEAGYRPSSVSYVENGAPATGLTPIVSSWTAPTAATVDAPLSKVAGTAAADLASRLARGLM